MISDTIQAHLKEADKHLQLAEQELNRPHEDVMTLSACQSVRTSLRVLMQQYLLVREVHCPDHVSLQDLLNLCTAHNPEFQKVDLRDIGCKGSEVGHENCDGRYCLSTESVGNCLKAARELKKTIWSELQIND